MSYGWLGAFRKGSWVSLRSFLLYERKDIGKRISVINSEIKRIGNITVQYNSVSGTETEENKMTEERLGFSVTKNSSLHKLITAYVVMGGNPLDISFFFIPDRAVLIDGNKYEEYPYGGMVYPVSVDYERGSEFGPSTSGFSPLRKYKPLRVGSRKDISVDEELFVNMVSDIRKFSTQEIRVKIHDMESRIIKLCDLREQLIDERDQILVQAFGGLVSSIPNFDTERFAMSLRVPAVIKEIDNIFFSRNDEGNLTFDSNLESLVLYTNLWDDILPEENNTSL
jgi:hypothetical protein